MREAYVKDIYRWLDSVAPFETAEAFDNVGLLIGSMDAPVRGIMVALDATETIVKEAAEKDVQLIVTHHPLMFHPIQHISADEHEGKVLSALLNHHMSLIAAHTNMDKTVYSGSACLAERLNLGAISQADDYIFMIDLHEAMPACDLEAYLEKNMGRKVMRFGHGDTAVNRLAVAGGAYDEGYSKARAFGAQALLTGEVRHHNAIAAAQSGMVLFEGGHFETEVPMIAPLCDGLQKALDGLECQVRVFCSLTPVY